VAVTTDLTITVDDQPGELARIGETLGKAGINIEGLAGFTTQGQGFIHVLVKDASGARSALEEAGLKISDEADALVMDLPSEGIDRPGTMGQMARKLADAGVNIQAIYLATKNRGVAVTSDNDKAQAALG
jgi:hypothetical protein